MSQQVPPRTQELTLVAEFDPWHAVLPARHGGQEHQHQCGQEHRKLLLASSPSQLLLHSHGQATLHRENGRVGVTPGAAIPSEDRDSTTNR